MSIVLITSPVQNRFQFFVHRATHTKNKEHRKITMKHHQHLTSELLFVVRRRCCEAGTKLFSFQNRCGKLLLAGFTYVCMCVHTKSYFADDGDDDDGEYNIANHSRISSKQRAAFFQFFQSTSKVTRALKNFSIN